MVKRVSNSAKRLKELMETLELSQVDLCKATGLSKSVISLYVNGKRDPRQDNLALIAETFNVDPSWLMGVDVPMRKEITFSKESADLLVDAYIEPTTSKVIEIMKDLDLNSRKEILKYALFIQSQSTQTSE